MAESQGEKTEKPTPKKLKEAKEKGNVARSRDLNLAVSSLTATGVLVWLGPAVVERLASRVADALIGVERMAGRDLQPTDLTSLVLEQGALIGIVVGPIAIAAAAAGVATAAAQGGLHFAPQALRIDLSRLSPANGLKRLAPSQSWINMLKTIVTVAVLGAIALQIGKALALEGVRFPWMSTVGAAGYGWASATRLLWQAGIALLAIGGVDYGLQRWQLMQSLKMSVQDVRDEGRSNEGSPEIKARVRSVQRHMAKRRMLQATAHATVVITNPTHYAVALEYRREKNPAPVVVAKGRDLMALRIREIARKNGVPIIDNPPLARALHQDAELGDTIPSALFGAVAEVLGYLVRIKQLML